MKDQRKGSNERVPSAGVSRFDQAFGKRIKGAAQVAGAPHRRPLVHEKESNLPNTLVPNLRGTKPVMQAAAGDDDLMSQQPPVAVKKLTPSAP